jgi:hypothetical protein
VVTACSARWSLYFGAGVEANVAAKSGAVLGLSIVDTLARRLGAKLLLSRPPEGRRPGFGARLLWQTSSR